MALLTPASVRALLGEHGLRPSRRRGQHFLADPNTARRIVRLAGVGPGDRVLEIGAGLGSLTLALRERECAVLAVEIDPRLVSILEREMVQDPDVRVVAGDALTIDLDAMLGAGPWRCVSNLPYNVATPVVIRLLEEAPTVTKGLVMVQREVAERLVAAPGTPAYGAPSVRVAYYAEAKIVGMVPRAVFVPVPKVDSALVELVRRDKPPVDVPSRLRLFELVRAGFAHRRQMLRRTLRPVLGERTTSILTDADVDPRARAESLGLPEWAALANAETES
ncbi:MAG TPA: 16S rRNA (adenine(1518)-N(6)/adenine(1519)-N(6))-dimethyltransferase RsmA [Acidimicrobiia bacterium]|jgi:16S rRNA (adenine1518-N6/adenine1519-N6)-dimethyltransferase|nr:16S rRNA (adenine(1518)-N(6)/adenine(1519)-N(6))-dimethyltransferase RsmA [Acidimicrobiia bacterium]